jgi:midasin
VLKAARHFWWDLFRLVNETTVENAAYQVHVQLGRQSMKIEELHDQPSTALVQAQNCLLQELSMGTVMTTGAHMERLWAIFRPQLVHSMDRISAYQDLKALADRFDAMTFPLRAPLEDLTRTRDELQVVLRASLIEEVDVKTLVEEVSTAMSTMEQPTESSATTAIFQEQFEAIYQYLSHGETEFRSSKVALLAGRPVSDASSLSIGLFEDNPLQLYLHRLSVFAHDAMVQNSPSALTGGLASSLSMQLKNTSTVPLSQLGQLRTELDIVAKLVVSHAHILSEDYQQCVAEVLHQLLSTWKSNGLPPLLNNPPASYDSNTLGRELITYAISCLLAYVPDRAFDPALKEQIQRQLLAQRRNACIEKLQALQHFEQFLSGQDSSIRIKLLAQELHSIGEHSPALQIARPEKSQLNDLQGDFSRVIEIVRQLQAQVGSTDSIVGGSVMQNIELLVKRFSEKYLAYRDIVMPAVQWLQCLWLGLKITQRAERKPESVRTMPSIWESLHVVATAEDAGSLSNIATSWEGMAIIAFDRKIAGPRDATQYIVSDFFEELFVTWKDKVNEEQAKHAKKSSLYVYRGDEDEQDQVDESEYAELFPDYESSEHHNRAGTEISATRDTAIRVANLYSDTFNPTFDTEEYIRNLIKHSSHADSGPVCENMVSALPRIFLMLEDQVRNVNATTIENSSYNIYQDANVPEATRLALIVRRVLARFRDLEAMDFEHSTIDDVVRLASEVVTFAHTEPVAKLLTKTEKLYGAMYEWEKVSHKGLSAAPLLGELTNLLVSWRRLELSTWMHLFSIEEQKATENAKSWWFIAYENIIANPKRLSKDDIILHAPELLKALEFFFQGATLGQFPQRLAILKEFVAHLAQIIPDEHEMGPLHSALGNFIAFYSRFEQPVTDSLKTQRMQLEKQAKEVVQLASWRDTNIEALKQSAQTSHRKLFKLVRKFRAVLNQPVTTILHAGPPDQVDTPLTLSPSSEHTFDESILSSARSIVGQLSGWSNVPARFKNTRITTDLMLRVGDTSDRLTGAQYLSDFLESLDGSVRDLQKATPSVLTEENKTEVKHLKTRKRALFADVLKQMRQMGFQYNLSSTVLAAQKSTAAVLAALPNGTTELPDYHLHKILALMPKVREIQREHSGDLTPAEVQRSSGYLEGMLHEIIQQRQRLLPWIKQSRKLTTLVSGMSALWDTKLSRPAAFSRNVPMRTFNDLERRLQWLVPMTHLLSNVLSAQQQLGGLQGSAVQVEVSNFCVLVAKLRSDLVCLQKLPAEITLQAHEEVFEAAREAFADFNSKLILWNANNSPVVPLLRLFAPWFQDRAQDIMNGNQMAELRTPHPSDASFSDMLSKVVSIADTVLASIQAIEAISKSVPAPGDQSGWLFLHRTRFEDVLKSLNLDLVIQSVDGCFESLASVHEAESSVATSTVILLQPILATYNHIVHVHLAELTDLHLSASKLSHELTERFVELGMKGFCTPPEKTAGEEEAGQDQKLEGGTGLGEGEGAEDISKDVGDDEDLTELAQEGDQNKDRDDIEDEQDAVDMADQEMEGQLGETTEKEEDGEQEDADEDDGDGPEEEAGSVDELGPEALDEKMWDNGDKVDDGEQKQTQKPQGQNNDEQVAAEATKKDQAGNDDEGEEEAVNAGAEEEEAVGQQHGEQMDDFVDEAEKLDLPEDLNMDGSAGEKSDDEDMDDLDEFGDERHVDETTIPEEMDNASAQEEPGSDGGAENPMVEDEEPDEMENDGSAMDDDVQDTDGEADMAPEDPHVENMVANKDHEPRTADDAVPSEAQGTGTDSHEDNTMQSEPQSQAKQDHGEQGDDVEDTGGASGDQGSQLDTSRQDAVGRSEDLVEATESQPFKQLGDALEKWFDQNRQIKRPEPETTTSDERKRDLDMADADFEHLLNEESTAETQALGTATEEQAKALNEDNAVAANEREVPLQSFLDESDGIDDDDETDAGYQTAEDTTVGEVKPEDDNSASNEPTQAPAKAFIGDVSNGRFDGELDENRGDESNIEEDQSEHDDTTANNISDELQAVSISEANARILWSQNELKTRTLAATLTEQLRLILAPTLATKLRGDFRTGKRLNIKRIIPYIASSYKRDKIWMRRSVPSKRAYQIMIAVDDSKSMAEHGKKDLAFETLALITKALSMLEVGELCVAGFGAEVQVAHPFEKPFTDDAGVEIFSKLSFGQEDTDVRKLVVDGFKLFQDARAKASSSSQDLWQLMLIVSDAICRDSDSIRRLVRKAQEEKIMIVFVVVDAGAKEIDGRQVGSIMDLQGAEFKDGQVKMYRYMDVFPFKWWIVVRDMEELPGVLSTALRQWFAEVVETGSK